jgi:RNA polymerase sigma factor (TIGR02999 family)
MTDITALLTRAGDGDADAANAVFPLVYARLKEIARRQLGREADTPSLATTMLVHDAYLALFGDREPSWRDRAHFYAYAGRAMRHILVDRARHRLREKRGGGAQRVELSAADWASDDDCLELVALDQALERLADAEPRLVRVVELRFFAGLSVAEVAAMLELDTRTIERDWQRARALIHDSMGIGA